MVDGMARGDVRSDMGETPFSREIGVVELLGDLGETTWRHFEVGRAVE